MHIPPAGKTYTIVRDDRTYDAFPDLLLTKSGRLILVYREGDDHVPNRTRLILLTSADRGSTWEQSVLSVQSHSIGGGIWNCPRLAQLSDNRIALVCDFKPKTGPFHGNSENYIWWSDDDGENWYGPVDMRCPGIMPDRIIELPSGVLLMGMTLRNPEDQRDLPTPPAGLIATKDAVAADDGGKEPPNFRLNYQAVYRSADGGERWGDPAVVAWDRRLSFCEGSITPLPDGRLACYLRENSFKGLPTFLTFSDDGGWTWSNPVTTDMLGHRPSSGLLADGRIFVTYRNVGALTGPQPENFFLPDDGAWKVHPAVRTTSLAWYSTAPEGPGDGLLEIESDSSRSIPDFGYTSWVQFDDAEILVAYHHRGGTPRSYIKGCRIMLPAAG